MLTALWNEVKSTFWVAVAVFLVVGILVLPPLLLTYLIGPATFGGFVFWSVVYLIVRAGVTKFG